MNRFGILVLAAGLSLVSIGCCKGSDSSSSGGSSTTAASAGKKTWNMDRVCDNFPGLRITQISVVGQETLVKMKFTNSEKEETEIQTAAPGTKETFFLENNDESKKIGLSRSEGIAVSPAKTKVKPGQTVEFVLVFPAIDESWGPIDIHEGQVKKKGQTFWIFEEIPLN